jgi:tetratricopeptide (TPR) repeat protein
MAIQRRKLMRNKTAPSPDSSGLGQVTASSAGQTPAQPPNESGNPPQTAQEPVGVPGPDDTKPARRKLIPHLWHESTSAPDKSGETPAPKEIDKGIEKHRAITGPVSVNHRAAARPVHKSKLSLIQMILIAAIPIIAGFLIYSLVSTTPPLLSGTPLLRFARRPDSRRETRGQAKQSMGAGDSETPGQLDTNSSISEANFAEETASPVAVLHPTASLCPPPRLASGDAGAGEAKRGGGRQQDAGAKAEQAMSIESQTQEYADSENQPLSLQLAESHYAAKDYKSAYDIYIRLRQNLITTQNTELVRDFLLLRMALCLKETGDIDQAGKLFRAVSQGRSVALQAIANYQLCLLEMNAGRYLKARTRSYKVIALTGALSSDSGAQGWPLAMEQDCHFLAAESVTRHVLSLCDADKDLPPKLWSHSEWTDVLTGLDEAELQNVLKTGIDRLSSGLLAPQIRAVESSSTTPGLERWTIICNGPGIEELMARFAANASLDVKWPTENRGQRTEDRKQRIDSPSSVLGPPSSGIPSSVICFMPAATTEQVVTIVAGAVGLLAKIDDKGVITITEPEKYSSLSQHTQELAEHATGLWRKLLLMYGDDQRVPNAHFALGVLQEHRDNPAEAIAEYKLIANRFDRMQLAPFALLRSSRIKTALRDYIGASSDLKQLIVQYPENELVGQAHLELADAAMKAGLFEQACSLYRKTYNLGFSNESRIIAAFGAGKCFYEMNDYESAVKWLNRYLDAAESRKTEDSNLSSVFRSPSSDLYTAYLLLGKSHLALGNLGPACDFLRRTAARAADSDEYVEAISALVETQIRQQDFVGALSTLENVPSWPFSQRQVVRLLLLKSNILREIGLAEKAISTLAERAQYITDPRSKAQIILELARCHVANENLDLARKYLIEAVSLFEPGPPAQQASCELAEVCLKFGDYEQAVSICTKLLDSPANEQIKQQASQILASAYNKLKQYDKAALALMTASLNR